MDVERVRRALVDTPFAAIDWVAETGSTNRDLLDVAASPAWDGEPRVLVTDHQHTGRGRRDRTWVEDPGSSLLVSVLLEPTIETRLLSLLTIACGLGAIEAATSVCGSGLGLKWPNDIVTTGPIGTSDRKVAGILAESRSSGGQVHAVVIGMGCNLRPSSVLPADVSDRSATLEELAAGPVDRDELLVGALKGFAIRLEQAERDGGATLLDEARAASATLHRQVRVETAATRAGTGMLEGEAVDLGADGSLVVRADGVDHVVVAADVVHLRPE